MAPLPGPQRARHPVVPALPSCGNSAPQPSVAPWATAVGPLPRDSLGDVVADLPRRPGCPGALPLHQIIGDCLLDPGLLGGQPDMVKEHRRRQDRGSRVSLLLPGEVRSGLMLAPAARPMPPATAAPRAVRISPNRLSVTITSNRSGAVTK